MRRAATFLAIAALALACGDDGSGAPDAAFLDADPGVDAAPDASADGPAEADAAPDAPPPLDAVPTTDASPLNPYRIRLVDRTEETTGTVWSGMSDADRWGVGTGAAIVDLDGDGDRDVFLVRVDDPTSGRPGGPALLLWNRGGPRWPRFEPDLDVAGLFTGVRAHGVAAGDLDRDGDLDLFVACEGRDRLLVNEGGGVFVERAFAAGVQGPDGDVSVSALFADLNADGLLDLFVSQHTVSNPPLPSALTVDLLYLNLGDGSFEEVAELAGVADDGAAHVALAADLGDAGTLDLVIANDRFAVDGVSGFGDDPPYPPDAWYAAGSLDGEGRPYFGDRAGTRGIVSLRSSMGIAVADVDGDLTPDLYVTDWGEKELYLNPTPGGAVVEGQSTYGLGQRNHATGTAQVSWGARFLDLDRDGLLELAIVNGTVSEAFTCEARKQVDVYLRQPSAGARYDDVTGVVGWPSGPLCGAVATGPNSGRGLVVGDLDGDRDDDLLVAGYVEPARTFENATPARHHAVRARLAGTVSAPDPIGARLVVTRVGGGQLARFRVAGGDTNSQSDGVLEVGLGDATAIVAAEVAWPSGLVQDVTAQLRIDGEVAIVEPRWLEVEPRVVASGAPEPVLVYRPVSRTGVPLGAGGLGRVVTVERSDGRSVVVTPMADGTYRAILDRPTGARRVVLTLIVDGARLPPRPRIDFR